MEDKSKNGIRRVLRICVEPVEVELDDDDAIPVTTLQAALPGASGLYFRNDDCKASLRFDGKKLLPPVDGWKDRKYYATLGCRPFDYPFGSYANATRQFERSVNTVQRLLANSKLFDYSLVERDIIASRKRAEAQRTSSLANAKSENMQQLLTAITQRQGVVETAGTVSEEQTPLEQQFVELARISTAKDSIIEQQRADLKVANEKLDQNERMVKCVQDDLSKLMKSCSVKEEELSVLRDLSKDQTFMCDKVNELTKKLLDRENTIAAQKKEIEFLVRKIARLDDEQMPSQKISKLGSSLESGTESTIQPLESPNSGRTQNGLKDSEVTFEQLMDALVSAKARNEKLENEVNVADEKYQQLNEVYTAVVAENTKLMAREQQEKTTNIIVKKESTDTTDVVAEDGNSWNAERLKSLGKELAASEKRVAELTRMVHVLTKEASDGELRAADAIAMRDAMKRSLDQAETKIQEAVQAERRECEFVRHDLQEAKRLIAELNTLIADFSNDARNSRRDVTDLL